ncbi:LpqB family beta-propeller domain-containing protein [Yinghuangia seranimata]|uniref:LpqB family beta-propeller domain-containing protein n=1 Tax=Yinghuangia seranimata TaxID=408067 RepID=UPI00248D35CC|nr:LpqB family beta-propeller domain-containing protein [Yinghuangia seranimata]MDI2131440.1 LpqB family beta-propeller domain-containing protein [Yinghuangia seranimata]
MTRTRSAVGTRRVLRALAVLWILCVLGGCASMPSHGKVQDATRDDAAEKADEQQVRVFGVPPQQDEKPTALVEGFLEAVTSDEPDYATARKYLTPATANAWQPVGVKVIESSPRANTPASSPPETNMISVAVNGKLVAEVAGDNTYQPIKSEVRDYHFELLRGGDGQWRIDKLPNVVLLSKADFRRIYTSVNLYWFSKTSDRLVPDPIYLRSRVSLMTTLAKQLLVGPTQNIEPAVETMFPAVPSRTAILDHTVSVDDDNAVHIQLTDEPRAVAMAECPKMATQMLYTLRQVAKVESVELTDRQGTLCVQFRTSAQTYDAATPTAPVDGYFIGQSHRDVWRLRIDRASPEKLGGALGDGSQMFSQIAVSRGSQPQIAAVDGTEEKLLVGNVDTGVLTTLAQAAPGHTFRSPSWGDKGVWVLEESKDHGTSDVVWIGATPDEKMKVPINIEGLGSKVTDIRVSPDGTRVALLTTGGQFLYVGIVTSTGSPSHDIKVTITGLRAPIPDLADAKSVSWNGTSRLVVLGTQDRGSMQPQYVDVDGGNPTAVAAIAGMVRVAAPDGADQPLLANIDNNSVFRLEPGNNWRQVTLGSYPAYPG